MKNRFLNIKNKTIYYTQIRIEIRVRTRDLDSMRILHPISQDFLKANSQEGIRPKCFQI